MSSLTKITAVIFTLVVLWSCRLRLQENSSLASYTSFSTTCTGRTDGSADPKTFKVRIDGDTMSIDDGLIVGPPVVSSKGAYHLAASPFTSYYLEGTDGEFPSY